MRRKINNFPLNSNDINSKIKHPLEIKEYKKLFNINNSKPKNLIPFKDKEELMEEIHQLKNKINESVKEISSLKSDNNKKDNEITQKDNLLSQFMAEAKNFVPLPLKFSSPNSKKNKSGKYFSSNNNNINKNYLNNQTNSTSIGNSHNQVFERIKQYQEKNLYKKQFKSMKSEYKAKCGEIEELKKNIKLTKLSEMNVEIFTLNEELTKAKSLINSLAQENEINKLKVKDISLIHENLSNQQNTLRTMQESIDRLEREKLFLESFNKELEDKLTEKTNRLNKLNADYKIFMQMNQKILKDRKEAKDREVAKKNLEQKVSDLQKELNLYKSLADQRDRKIKEFEKLHDLKAKKEGLEHISNNSSNGFNNTSIGGISHDYKFIQENPESKINNIEAHLRNRLTIISNSHDMLALENKNLQQKLQDYEQEIQRLQQYNNTYNTNFNSNISGNNISNNYITNNPNSLNNCYASSDDFLINNNKQNQQEENTIQEVYIGNEEWKNNNAYSSEGLKPIKEEFESNNKNSLDSPVNEAHKNYNNQANLISNIKVSDLSVEEFSYILIKNFEARKIDVASALQELFDSLSLLDINKKNLLSNGNINNEINNNTGSSVNNRIENKTENNNSNKTNNNNINLTHSNSNNFKLNDSAKNPNKDLVEILAHVDAQELIGLIKDKIIHVLNLKNKTDQIKVEEFLMLLCQQHNKNLINMLQHLISMISSVRFYKPKKEAKYKKKLIKVKINSFSPKYSIYKSYI